ncbi:hypothetical protein ACIQD3_07010 [Peribacillus loiseleuriae]|uniref:hypothetical protein n=1 Tax=Peribacillus loiseleuriae TaxID=1679170 RepID=UPI0038017F55
MQNSYGVNTPPLTRKDKSCSTQSSPDYNGSGAKPLSHIFHTETGDDCNRHV